MPANPITNPGELAVRLRELTGCDGYRIEGNVAVCLRWDHNGSEVIVDRVELCGVDNSGWADAV